MNSKNAMVAKAEMLIRKPVADVFEAFVNPAITTKFWFTKSSGRLEPGKRIRWDWEMFDVSDEITVKAVEPNRRIFIEWSGPDAPTTVEWLFTPRADGTTLVTVTNAGFVGDAEETAKQVIDSTEGFTLVLAGLKAFLEHGIRLNLIADRHPDGIVQHTADAAPGST